MHSVGVNEGALSSFFPQHFGMEHAAARAAGRHGSLCEALWSPTWNEFTVAVGSFWWRIAESESSYHTPKGKSLEENGLPNGIIGQLEEHAWKPRDESGRDCLAAWLGSHCFQTLHNVAPNSDFRKKTLYWSLLGHQPSSLIVIGSTGELEQFCQAVPTHQTGISPK